jgi:hypothetical protein
MSKDELMMHLVILAKSMRNSDYTALSGTLENSFGFKKAQWASIISVERKTLYNWRSKPKTSDHATTWLRTY